MPTGGGPCFFEDVLQPLEAIVVADDRMWHHATNILPALEEPGHRDIMIISFCHSARSSGVVRIS